MARFYNLIFVFRRIIFVVLIFFKNENGGLQVVINIFINLAYGIYFASARAFKKRRLN
jgi:hypothetical protein